MSNLTMEEYRVRNPRDWKRLIDGLFPIAVPDRAKWEQPQQIIAVLNQIGSVQSVNHLFFPDGGGADLLGAAAANERGLISLNCDGTSYYVKPESLSFESFGDQDDYQLSYFRLELTPIPDTGTYPGFGQSGSIAEELLELSPGQYVDRSSSDAGEHQGQPLPKDARVIVRLLSGSMVIFQKSSLYNKIPATYDAPHDKVDGEQFRLEIAKLRQKMIASLASTAAGPA